MSVDINEARCEKVSSQTFLLTKTGFLEVYTGDGVSHYRHKEWTFFQCPSRKNNPLCPDYQGRHLIAIQYNDDICWSLNTFMQ